MSLQGLDTVKFINVMLLKFMYDRTDGMSNSLESMVVYEICFIVVALIVGVENDCFVPHLCSQQ